MAKIFYTASDEEITSVIDKLKKVSAKEVIFVVPSRALIVQSIVNLKLLKREAEQSKKKIILVIKDEAGRMLAEKVGILVARSLEGLNMVFKKEADMKKIKKDNVLKKIVSSRKDSVKNRLERLGSKDFFAYQKRVGNVEKPSKSKSGQMTASKKKRIRSHGQDNQFSMIRLKSKQKNTNKTEGKIKIQSEVKTNHSKNRQKREIEKIFKHNPSTSLKLAVQPKKKNNKPKVNVSEKAKYFLGGFSLLLIGVVIFLVVYIWLPKALIKIDLKKINREVEMTAQARVNIKNNQEIPLRIVEGEEELVQDYPATGQSKIADKKARGMVTIYNESLQKQPLVVSTRLMTRDGKIFRLIKSVVVPAQEGNKAGKIEVGVIADKAGQEYNISPTNFSIPGLKGTDQYDKIYARSEKRMIGGGGEAEIKVVSKADMEKARKKTLKKVVDKVLLKQRNQLKEGENFTSDMLSYEIIDSFISPGEGMVADKFDYKIKIKYQLAVFSEKNVRDRLAKKALEDVENNSIRWKIDEVKLRYGKNDCDFKQKACLIKAVGNVSFVPEFDTEVFRKKISGKNEKDLKRELKKFPQIENIQVEFSPTYLPMRIPTSSKKVEIMVK